MAYLNFTFQKNNKAVLHSDAFDIIREQLSVETELFLRRGGKFQRKKTRTYAITSAGVVDIGLVPELVKLASQLGFPVSVSLDDKVKSILKPSFKFEENKQALAFDQFELRPYQKESVELAVPRGRGIIVLPTATGKTLTMASLIKTILNENPLDDKHILILVPDIGLVNQTHADFLKYGLEYSCSKWSGSFEFDSTSKVIVCNQAILRSESQQEIVQYLKKNTGLIIVDEVHTLKKDNASTKIIDEFETIHRYGFTGTLPDAQLDYWTLLGKIGPVLSKVEAHEMRSDEWIADVIAKIIFIKHQNPPHIVVDIKEPNKAYLEETEWLIQNHFRNTLMCNFANKLKKNSLLLVNRKEHGRQMLEIAKSLDVNNEKEIYFIEGEVDVEEREKVQKMMEEKDNIICIAMSSIFSTGISINNLHYVFFCSGGKSRIRIIQSIGRGSRLHHSKEKMILFDFADNTRYSFKHLQQRISLYKQEKISHEKIEIKEV